MSDTAARRPIKSRDTKLAQRGAQWLLRTGLSPNAVSVFSVIFALICSLFLYLTTLTQVYVWVLWLLAAIMIQLRLLCNLFDGMMAVEGGLGTANGDLYNEIPDRLSDTIIFVAAGYACEAQPMGMNLGWFITSGCLLTAYMRLHGASLTGKHDFGGPMAKAQRMAAMTALCLLMIFIPQNLFEIYPRALLLIGIGTWITFILRMKRLSADLMITSKPK